MIIKKDPDAIRTYCEDSSNLKGGHAESVVLPETIEDLSLLVRSANSGKIPLTVSGGGTGTTGSRIPFGGTVVSMERFNMIHEVSNKTMSARLESGVMVEDLKCACEHEGLFYTSHPTEKTASVGGTVATNASGSRSFKYGPTRKYVKRLKMVLATGDIFDIKRGERRISRADSKIVLDGGREIDIPIPAYEIPNIKNSAGYFAKDGMDLIDLFIGQEGTLSIITEVELELVKKPSKILSCFVFFRSEEGSWLFAEDAKAARDALSIEYFDSNAVRLLRLKDKNVPEWAMAAIFFEQEATDENEDGFLKKWLKLISKHGASPDDTWVAMNEKEQDRFTKLRHYIPESINDNVRKSGYQKLSTDIAVPSESFMGMMNFYRDTFERAKISHVIFGHIGESHVHVNLLPQSYEELDAAKDICLSFVKKGIVLGGSISAEHGVGKTKHKYLEIMYGKEGILDMARIKKAFDPNCILGLDNIFPRGILESA